ncbi:PAS domain S-box-containing protein/diguanylate cyclase (GGDEF)-like protein [Humitalea rosea]|uniref:PAS domain S-box-containing protein/diguanylate cyclase (GGDEF)-like protein n=2 Tax=Humitalea rosea TaxID=990373 RepID=A0A2W7KKR9_9PROT|nr:PAS domain S-box-containing protein/diguanylate cyclase (GGDEF)-like protein [Humitalea rosea]
MLLYASRRRPDLAHAPVLWMSAAFILLCGTTHWLDVLTLWVPAYSTQVIAKAVTAAISFLTAVTLWRFLPRLLALPSPAQMRAANQDLQQVVQEREKALEALRASERRYRALTEVRAGSSAFWIAEPTGAVREMRGWEALAARPEASMQGLAWMGSIHPEDRAATIESWKQARATQDPLDLEFRVATGGQGWRWVGSRGVPVFDEDQRLVEWVGMIEDVHERRQATEDLRRTRTMLDQVIKNIPAMIFVKDMKTGRFTFINRAGEELLGVTSAALLGTTDHDHFPKEQADFFIAHDRAVAASGLAQVIEEEAIDTPSGTRLLRTTKIPMPGSEGGPNLLLGFCQDITDRKQAEAHIRHLALHDPLTGLANRHLLNESIREAAARGARFAVLCLDLDAFKRVNDTRGHEAGDRLLVQVAERLRGVVREGDVLARLGGDEFVILQMGVTEPEAVTAYARRVVDEMARPFDLDLQQVVIGASIGIAMCPADGTNLQDLLRHADTALYKAKADGRGRFQRFNTIMNTNLQDRYQLEADLREAIEARHLLLHYQPICDAKDGAILGFEALARWCHPVRGNIPPGVFVPMAEECGLIIPLGRLVLETACAEAAGWAEPARIAVNVSPAQFRVEDLAGEIAEILRRTGLSGDRLELEVTESLMIDDPERVLRIMLELKQLGVRIALDDFGTGYASLIYLRRFPFDQIKIDQSFVRGLDQEGEGLLLFSAILNLGISLGLEVLTEGVETEAQLEIIRGLGGRMVQGYLFGRPGPAAEARERLAHGHAPCYP